MTGFNELIYANAINTELVLLYWNIGRIIKTEILLNEKAEYGTQAVEGLSSKLISEYGRGYSVRNLFYMIKFYEVFNDEKILHTVYAKLTWSHLRRLIYIEDDLRREFYIAMSVSERWSFRTLNERIKKSINFWENEIIS